MSSLPTTDLRREESADEYMRSRYTTTSSLAASLYGKIVLGTRSDGQKEICKISDKRRLRSSHLLEDPLMEIHVMRQLQGCDGHVQLIDAFQDDAVILIVVEYVDGGDLYDYMSTRAPHGIGVDRARKLTSQLCAALLRMHELGYCHLDISLENILIDSRTHTLKLCDYGLSRRFSSSSCHRFGSTRINVGKKQYNCPEMIRRQAFDGELADVWAVAIVFWILLTGHPPFSVADMCDIRFACLMNRDCSILLRKCRLIDRVPERERLILNDIFVDEHDRIGLVGFGERLAALSRQDEEAEEKRKVMMMKKKEEEEKNDDDDVADSEHQTKMCCLEGGMENSSSSTIDSMMCVDDRSESDDDDDIDAD